MSDLKKNEQKFEKIDLRMLNYDFSDFPEKKEIWAADKKLTQQAYKKLGEIWNKDSKSRGFLKHIISAFFPINQFNKILQETPNVNMRCAILNIKLAGVKEISKSISKLSMKKMFIDAKCVTEKREKYNQSEIDELDLIRKQLPIAHKNGSTAYFSDTSTKFLSIEAIIALQYFLEKMILLDNKEIMFTINKRRISETQTQRKNKLSDKQINLVSKATTYGIGDNLDSKTFNALNQLKNQLQNDK